MSGLENYDFLSFQPPVIICAELYCSVQQMKFIIRPGNEVVKVVESVKLGYELVWNRQAHQFLATTKKREDQFTLVAS